MFTRDERHISELLKLAEDVPPIASARIAACLVLKNDILSYGFNSLKSHPFQKRFGKNGSSIFLHAETDAIKNALNRVRHPDALIGSTLYVARAKHANLRSKNFVSGLACPCEGCQRAIVAYGIKKVVYTLNDSGFDYL